LQKLSFRTRKRGTPKQIGKKFPVLEKKKLPKRISLPSLRNKATGITDLTYIGPTLEKPGYISFNMLGEPVEAKIQLVDSIDNVAQWGVNNSVVYLDKKVPMPYQKYLSCHELIEQTLERKYGIPWNPYGHAAAEELEKRLFRQSHPEREWKNYSKFVKTIYEMNRAGGKTGHKKTDLARAFELLAEKRRQLKWAERGIDSVVRSKADRLEHAEFSRDLKRSIDRHLRSG
jgi:hypothetical protein